MKVKKYLIAGGNPTLIVWGCPKELKKGIIDKYLGEVEQIGFVSNNKTPIPIFNMMGEEFCGNATIAFASTLKKNGKFKTSGISKLVDYKNNNNSTSISVFLPHKIHNNIVIFEGIGYLCINKQMKIKKDYLENMCNKYNLPAFGVAICINNKLTPYVYVKNTNSFFKETSCGSGSIAANIIFGLNEIIQLSEEKILIKRDKNKFTLTTKVTLLPINGLTNKN